MDDLYTQSQKWLHYPNADMLASPVHICRPCVLYILSSLIFFARDDLYLFPILAYKE